MDKKCKLCDRKDVINVIFVDGERAYLCQNHLLYVLTCYEDEIVGVQI